MRGNYTVRTDLLILQKTVLVQGGSVLLLILTIYLKTRTQCTPILSHNKSRSLLLISTKSRKERSQRSSGFNRDRTFLPRTHRRMTETTPPYHETTFVCYTFSHDEGTWDILSALVFTAKSKMRRVLFSPHEFWQKDSVKRGCVDPTPHLASTPNSHPIITKIFSPIKVNLGSSKSAFQHGLDERFAISYLFQLSIRRRTQRDKV